MPDKIIVPHENDVLMGRGGNNNQHSGNEKLRELAGRVCSAYQKSTKKGKAIIARDVVQQMRELVPAARFLKRNDSNYREWEQLPDKVAREKASQVIRDALLRRGALGTNKRALGDDRSQQRRQQQQQQQQHQRTPSELLASLYREELQQQSQHQTPHTGAVLRDALSTNEHALADEHLQQQQQQEQQQQQQQQTPSELLAALYQGELQQQSHQQTPGATLPNDMVALNSCGTEGVSESCGIEPPDVDPSFMPPSSPVVSFKNRNKRRRISDFSGVHSTTERHTLRQSYGGYAVAAEVDESPLRRHSSGEAALDPSRSHCSYVTPHASSSLPSNHEEIGNPVDNSRGNVHQFEWFHGTLLEEEQREQVPTQESHKGNRASHPGIPPRSLL